jgi:hypothetical protein
MYKNKYQKYKKKYLKLKKFVQIGSNDQIQLMDFNNRINYYHKLKIECKNNSDCWNNLSNKYKIIGRGKQATVYEKNIQNISIAVKDQKIKNKFDQRRISNEYLILKEITKFVLNHTTQNLPLMYQSCLCRENNKSLFYLELAHGDLIVWVHHHHGENEWMSFLFQIWTALYTLQKHLKMVHGDLKYANILYYKTNKNNNEYWKYTIDNVSYYIPNEGYVFVIADFGISEIISDTRNPKSSMLKYNTDLYFLNDLYYGLKVLILTEKYTTTQLEKLFDDKKDMYYLTTLNKKHPEKYKKALAYYLIEKNKDDKLYDEYQYMLPPLNVMNIFEELHKKNYTFEDYVRIREDPSFVPLSILDSSRVLIDKYFSQYTKKQNYSLEFVI